MRAGTSLGSIAIGLKLIATLWKNKKVQRGPQAVWGIVCALKGPGPGKVF
jgi:hypothetical protein